MLHLIGIAIGFAANRMPVRFAARTAGGAIAALGVVLLVVHCSAATLLVAAKPAGGDLHCRRKSPVAARRLPPERSPGKISDLITTGTAPELSSMVPMSM